MERYSARSVQENDVCWSNDVICVQETDVNSRDMVNGFTEEQTTKNCDVSATLTTEDELHSSDTIDDQTQMTVTDSADPAYDLGIHNQALLWKALPKPSNTSQVCFHYSHLFPNHRLQLHCTFAYQ